MFSCALSMSACRMESCGATLSIGRTLYNAFNKDKKDHPALLSEGGEVPHVYIGKNETIEGLIGGVENKNGVAPQDRVAPAMTESASGGTNCA